MHRQESPEGDYTLSGEQSEAPTAVHAGMFYRAKYSGARRVYCGYCLHVPSPWWIILSCCRLGDLNTVQQHGAGENMSLLCFSLAEAAGLQPRLQLA